MTKKLRLSGRLHRTISLIAIIALLNLNFGCGFYNKSVSFEKSNNNSIENLKKYKNKYNIDKYRFVLHYDENMLGLDNVHLSTDKITATFKDLNEKEISYYNKLNEKKIVTGVPFGDRKYMYQVHIFADKFIQTDSIIEIAESDIKNADVYNYNSELAALSFMGTAAVTGGILVLIACNCPYVYDGDQSTGTFLGNLYQGAIYPNLERTDYLILNNPSEKNENLQLEIANIKNENIYTNSLDLLVIEHPENVRILPDQEGIIHSISNPKQALNAFNSSTINYTEVLQSKDDRYYSFDNLNKNESLSTINLIFEKEKFALNAKLLLTVKNSEWAGYAYNEICKNMGYLYPKWQKRQMSKSGEEIINKSLANGIQMQVLLKTTDGWRYIDKIYTVGSVKSKDVIIPIDLAEVEGDEVEIMLKSGFMFWDLDYAAIDFSKDMDLAVKTFKPVSAKDSLGNDFLGSLLNIDDNYMHQSELGKSVYIEFPDIEFNPELEHTLILKGSGYYTRKSTYKNSPDFVELIKLRRKGGFSLYSKKIYDQLLASYMTSL